MIACDAPGCIREHEKTLTRLIQNRKMRVKTTARILGKLVNFLQQ